MGIDERQVKARQQVWPEHKARLPNLRQNGVIGQQRVQGVDYAYTLQGWLKGINGSNGYIAYDMGLDAWAAARDAYGYTLHYFGDDYNPVNYSTRPFAEYRYNMLSLYPGDYRELYNGNISATSNSIPSRYLNQLYNYEYDQLNRLVACNFYELSIMSCPELRTSR